MDCESDFSAKRLQLFNTGLGIAPKSEVAALVQAADAKRFHQNLAHKLPGRQHGQRRVEGQHQNRIDARRGQQLEALTYWCQQLERVSRTQKLLRVRVEGDGNRMDAMRARLGHYCGENLPVTEMHAVEVADDGDGGAKSCGNLLQRAEDGNRGREIVLHRVTGRVRLS